MVFDGRALPPAIATVRARQRVLSPGRRFLDVHTGRVLMTTDISVASRARARNRQEW
jgi:hypothetical protein